MTAKIYKRSNRSVKINSRKQRNKKINSRKSRKCRPKRRQSARLSSVYRKKMLLGGGESQEPVRQEPVNTENKKISEGLEKAIEELIQSLKKSTANCTPGKNDDQEEEKSTGGSRQMFFGGYHVRNLKKSRRL